MSWRTPSLNALWFFHLVKSNFHVSQLEIIIQILSKSLSACHRCSFIEGYQATRGPYKLCTNRCTCTGTDFIRFWNVPCLIKFLYIVLKDKTRFSRTAVTVLPSPGFIPSTHIYWISIMCWWWRYRSKSAKCDFYTNKGNRLIITDCIFIYAITVYITHTHTHKHTLYQATST